jgi:hypothetical protein
MKEHFFHFWYNQKFIPATLDTEVGGILLMITLINFII